MKLDAPESPDEARQCQEHEAAQARRAQDRATIADRQAAPLIGSTGDIGQRDLLDGSDLFSR